MSTPILPLLTTVLLFLAGGEPGFAQQGNQPTAPTRVPVTVAVMDELPVPGAPSVILRRADISPHDVILLRTDAADGKELSSAVYDLLLMREQFGDTASANGIMRIKPKEGPPGRIRQQLPWAQRVVVDARKAEPKWIEGVGMVKAVEIWLPAKDKKGKKPRKPAKNDL